MRPTHPIPPLFSAPLRLCVSFLLCLVASATAQSPPPPSPPNILYIMADDHAAHALSCYGSRINSTPNIDRLAAQGMRFTNAFSTNAICTPARACLLTGQYSHKNGVRTNSDVLPADALDVARLLGQSGYQTAIIGKWHLHRDPTGFDHWDILPSQGAYHDPEFITRDGRTKHTGYVTDITIDKCIQWIRVRPKRDEAPFILFCHLKAPHRNWEPDSKHAHLYDDADIPLPGTFDDDYATRSYAAARQTMTIERDLTPTDLKQPPPEGLSGHDLKVWQYQRYIKDYLRCIASIDDNIGRLMAFLDESGLADNTIVIYTSDQGFFLGDHGWYDKRFMYEESLRMPLIVRYPPEVAPGSICDRFVHHIDFAPTFLDFAGAPPTAAPEMQGRSIRPLLQGKPPPDWRTTMYYHYYESGEPHTVAAHYGIRTERYKLIRFYDPQEAWELYDLRDDGHELRNLYDRPESAGIIADLRAQLADLRRRYADGTGPPLDPR